MKHLILPIGSSPYEGAHQSAIIIGAPHEEYEILNHIWPEYRLAGWVYFDMLKDDEPLVFAGEIPRIAVNVKSLVESLLAKPCACGAPRVKERTPSGELDIVCSKACGERHPIDTGPFSLGRRVD